MCVCVCVSQGETGVVFYLTLDVVETNCSVLSRKDWKTCEARPVHDTPVGKHTYTHHAYTHSQSHKVIFCMPTCSFKNFIIMEIMYSVLIPNEKCLFYQVKSSFLTLQRHLTCIIFECNASFFIYTSSIIFSYAFMSIS